MTEKNVLIVGAGPVGLFTALRLGQKGLKVNLFERATEVDQSPRAAGYYGPVLDLYKRAGIYDLVSATGHEENGLSFRRMPVDDGKGGKTFGKEIGQIRDLQIMLPQSKLAKIIEKVAIATGNVTVHYAKEVVGIQEIEGSVTATVRVVATGTSETYTGTYLVGTDGGRSTVRSLLGLRFPGHTWPERVIATNVTLVSAEIAPISLNFIIDPVHWTVFIPLSRPEKGKKSLWRYAMAVAGDDPRTDEELLESEALDVLYQKVMVGPRPLQYEVQSKTVYHIHQRLAPTMRSGRCLLAGDAAHLNSPVGAMGLSSGLLDAETAADALTMVLNEGYPETLLDAYSAARREVFRFFVDPMTTENKLRVSNDPDWVEREDDFIRMLRNPALNSTEAFEKVYNERWVTNIRSKAAAYGIKPSPT